MVWGYAGYCDIETKYVIPKYARPTYVRPNGSAGWKNVFKS